VTTAFNNLWCDIQIRW